MASTRHNVDNNCHMIWVSVPYIVGVLCVLCKQFLRHRPLHREALHRPWRRGRASFSQHLGNGSFSRFSWNTCVENNFLSVNPSSSQTNEEVLMSTSKLGGCWLWCQSHHHHCIWGIKSVEGGSRRLTLTAPCLPAAQLGGRAVKMRTLFLSSKYRHITMAQCIWLKSLSKCQDQRSLKKYFI